MTVLGQKGAGLLLVVLCVSVNLSIFFPNLCLFLFVAWVAFPASLQGSSTPQGAAEDGGS